MSLVLPVHLSEWRPSASLLLSSRPPFPKSPFRTKCDHPRLYLCLIFLLQTALSTVYHLKLQPLLDLLRRSFSMTEPRNRLRKPRPTSLTAHPYTGIGYTEVASICSSIVRPVSGQQEDPAGSIHDIVDPRASTNQAAPFPGSKPPRVPGVAKPPAASSTSTFLQPSAIFSLLTTRITEPSASSARGHAQADQSQLNVRHETASLESGRGQDRGHDDGQTFPGEVPLVGSGFRIIRYPGRKYIVRVLRKRRSSGVMLG